MATKKPRLRKTLESVAEEYVKRKRDNDDLFIQLLVKAYWEDRELFEKHFREIENCQDDD